MTLNNYKDLCELLGESVKGGKGKKYQLEDWERYFTFKKNGHKFGVVNISLPGRVSNW